MIKRAERPQEQTQGGRDAALGDDPSQRPDIARFTDYRAFARAMYLHLKRVEVGYSYRVFSRRAGFSSPNFLKLVADGHRNLSLGSVGKFARGLSLTSREQDVFEAMVAFDRATTDSERNKRFRNLQALNRRAPAAQLNSDQFAIYDNWYSLAIREMVLLPDFEEDPDWIARRLRPRITVRQARKALERLLRVGLLVRDEYGDLAQAAQPTASGAQVKSLAVRNYHRAQLALATQALEDVDRDSRDVTSLVVTLTDDRFERVRQELAELRRRVRAMAAEPRDSEDPTEIHELVLALFPLSKAR